ncbi:hypothetical protein F441_15871 [Phytophthora nicotianae CJ01A1]|uniref:FYVE-type domain-containing protein n=4 Tax=Phytophthora nicotianae TaxID=4792 RepID=V9EG45_PHYNI|nr:hypothetical protein F443_16031 [Phytophthora nicotianae P1569]ETK78354.1 hypothetical protein L915_15590 [Phytophthora nicotianae]ETO66928.1 hypothetical protein F444_16017 [Phytophthora nicotianae P1976]ETP08024.1 hypothetical protein F441_15871 [Phytophthora nicotianae CJ01A1]ETL31779.1 hypothetical protein L916_15486 [Phytophthora nicotianae]
MAGSHARRATTLPDDGTPMDSRPKTVDRRPTVPEDHDYDSKVPQPKKSTTPKLYLKEGEAQAFRHLAHSIVSRTLAHECEFRQLGCPEPNSKEWKLLKRQDDLSVYKQRGSSDSKTYTVKCVGSLEGTLEDILYGTHSKNREEMHATAAYLHSSHMDCAVLNVLDSGTDEDPYRQLALKWFIAETIGDARLVKHRDWFNIESTGMGTDAWGRRYGYFLAKFADHPGCPPMPENSDVIRGKMAMCCIYRQEAGSKIVDVYAKGSIDLGGGMPAFITSSASCSMMFNMAVSMESAEAKRLTKLALQHAQREAKKTERKDEADYENEIETSQKLTTESVFDMLAASVISSSTTSSNEGKIKAPKTSREPCHVCGKKPAMSKLVRSSHRKCGVCKERACSKCNIKRKLFGRAGPVTVSCCKVCILESKRLSIDPREPCPILP